jgi:hypothetical protein
MGPRFQLKRLGAGESFSCGESVATDFVSSLSLSLLFVCFPETNTTQSERGNNSNNNFNRRLRYILLALGL